MTSKFEGFCVVLIEAMSVGLPVVSYACPCGPKDIITDGEDGFLVNPGKEEELAEKICYLIEDESIRQRIGINGLKEASRFALDKVIWQWMELFQELS